MVAKALRHFPTEAAKARAGPPLRGVASNFGLLVGLQTSPGPLVAQGKSIGFYELGWQHDFPRRVP